MTEPTSPESAGPPTGAAPSVDVAANLRKLPFVEKVLAPLAILVILGCLLAGSRFWRMLFHDWFYTLAFLGSLAVAALIILKVFGVRVFAPAVEGKAIAVASLVPALGLVFGSFQRFDYFLVVGGSLALAYISAMAYWKKHLPEIREAPSSAGAPPGGESSPGGPGAAPAP